MIVSDANLWDLSDGSGVGRDSSATLLATFPVGGLQVKLSGCSSTYKSTYYQIHNLGDDLLKVKLPPYLCRHLGQQGGGAEMFRASLISDCRKKEVAILTSLKRSGGGGPYARDSFESIT